MYHDFWTQVVCVFLTQKAETRPGIHEGSLVICTDVYFVAGLDEAKSLFDLKILLAILGVISCIIGLLGRANRHVIHVHAMSESWASSKSSLSLID